MWNKALVFPETPFIFRYIKFEYDEANELKSMIDLFHKWQDVIEYTENPVKKAAFTVSANALYSEITNLSFETKKFQSI